MAQIKAYTSEKLIIGLLISDLSLLKAVSMKLQKIWGSIDHQTLPEEFSFSDYYNAEMGTPLYRVFFSFERLINPENLAAIKIQSNALEDHFLSDSGRRINLDPGMLCQSKFILATTKNNAHRIPLSRGIYAELTLQFRHGEFCDLEWTYPDYREKTAKEFLMDVRQVYVKQLKMIIS